MFTTAQAAHGCRPGIFGGRGLHQLDRVVLAAYGEPIPSRNRKRDCDDGQSTFQPPRVATVSSRDAQPVR